MRKFQNHLDELCISDEEIARLDEAQRQGVKGPRTESIQPGATIHDEVATPFPGLQEMPQHAV